MLSLCEQPIYLSLNGKVIFAFVDMTKIKDSTFTGHIKAVPHCKIYLTIDHLTEGQYTLHVTCKGKTIKTMNFKKG